MNIYSFCLLSMFYSNPILIVRGEGKCVSVHFWVLLNFEQLLKTKFFNWFDKD